MGWLVGGLVKKDVILSDFGNLNSKVRGGFEADINQCSAWDGRLGSRMKRSAEDLEASFESAEAGGLLDWVKTLVRSKRQAPGPKRIIQKKAKQPLPQQGRVLQKRKVQPQPRQGPRGGIAGRGQPNRNIPQKSIIKKNRKKIIKKVPKNPDVKTSSVRRTINVDIYNRLWCFDLAVGQALKKCVEELIKS